MTNNNLGDAMTSQVDNFYLRHCVTQSILYSSLIAPPLMLARAGFRGSPLTLNRFLRTNAALVFLGGGTAGAAFAFARTNGSTAEALKARVDAIRHNGLQVSKQDHSTVGAVLGTLITTTLLLKRASTLNTIFGGASLGIAGGTATFYVRSQTWNQESRQVLGQVVPVAHEAAEAATEVKDKAIDMVKKDK